MIPERDFLDVLATEFRSEWQQTGSRPELQKYLHRVDPDLRLRLAQLLIPTDVEYRR